MSNHRFAFVAVLGAVLALPAVAGAQITIGPYSFPDETPFVDAASFTGTPSYTGGATNPTEALAGYSPTTGIVNIGYPCSGGAEVAEMELTDVVAANRPGADLVLFDARYSSDDYEVAVRPVGGSFTTYVVYPASGQVATGASGPGSSDLWGVEVELDDFGLAAGTAVDAVRVKGDCATNPDSLVEIDLVMGAVLNSGCAVDADCDDGDECTADTCLSSGECDHEPEPEGTACSAGVCDGDPTAPACVECTMDTHCDETLPFCDATTSTCVECAMDADCDDGVECTTDTCADGACASAPAPSGTACSAGVCDGASSCVGCLSDDDCGAGVCDVSTMACVECLESDDCSAGVCDVSTMACVECLSDDDCGGTLSRCDATANTCVECLADTECDDADACTFDSCDPATWSCRHEIRSECLDAGTPDAGTPDAGAVETDASTPPADAGTGPVMDGGCGCRAAGGTGTTAPVWLLGLALLLWRRRSR